MTDIKVIFAQTTVNDTEKVIRVDDLIAYIKAKMPKRVYDWGDYNKGKEDILDDIIYDIENAKPHA